MSDFHEPEGEVAAIARHASAQARYAEILTGRATDEQIQPPERRCPLQEVVGRDVAEVRAVGKARLHHGGGKLLDLRVPKPGELRPAKLWRTDAGKTGRGP